MSAERRLARFRSLAQALGHLAERGPLQHFFVSPVLPTQPLCARTIRTAFAQRADTIRAGEAPELVNLYLHIPFCQSKCRYCIYHSLGDFDPSDLTTYLERLHAEIDYFAQALTGVRLATCYVGGGTPTVLEEDPLERLLTHVSSTFGRRPGGEWAFECSPLSATPNKVAIFERHGFNRISFGVQSLRPDVLQAVNRGLQTERHVLETIRLARQARFWINVDLIAGLPGDAPDSLVDTVARLLDLGVTQITVYSLSPYTPHAVPRADTLPLSDLARRVAKVTGPREATVQALPTCLEVKGPAEVLRENRLSEERRQAGQGFSYDDLSTEPCSLLALGPTTRGTVYGELSYRMDAFPVTDPFDPDATIAQGRELTLHEERRRFVTRGLSEPSVGAVDEDLFLARFGQPLTAFFGPELTDLSTLGLVEHRETRWRLTAEDPVERFAAILFFVDEAMIQAAEQQARPGPRLPSGPAPEPHVDLQLTAAQTRVTVSLVAHRPGRRCFAHHGGFAFFERTDRAAPTGHSPVEEALLQAFRRLFGQVVREARPDSLDALAAALLERGQGLHLARRTRGEGHGLPVRLTRAPP